MTTQIVLVPGFWLGAWAWDEVVPLLREKGYDVTALTLPGLAGEDGDPGPVEQADAIVAALDRDAERRVLAVHSGAAAPGTVVIDRHPDLVDHVVYVDTAPVADGYAMNPELATAALPLEEVWEDELANGSMRDLTQEQLATFRSRAVPQPGRSVSEPVHLTDPRRLTVPGTVVCTSYSADDYRSYATQGAPFLAGLLEHTGLRFVDLPTGHWPMWSRPGDLADVIAEAAAS